MQTQEQRTEIKFAVVAVDVVIFTVIDDELNVVLIKPNKGPFAGRWALPGGLVRPDEDLPQAVRRHLTTKTGVGEVYVEQLYTFGRVDRDPRGRVVSTAYFALVPAHQWDLKTTEDYDEIEWVPVKKVGELAYDHNEILDVAVERLKSKLAYTNIIYSLLPTRFTLSEMQQLYETILGKELDKRNFRRKVLSLKLVRQTKARTIGEPNRPAQLYEFVRREPQVVELV